MSSGARSGDSSEIIVQVRNPDGNPASSGIHLRLESEAGSNLAECETEGAGKCRFTPGASGRYVVRARQFGYRDVSVTVELVDTLRAYITLELKPETGTTLSNSRPGNLRDPVSVLDLNVPENARAEFKKGQAALKENNFDASITHLRKAIKLHAAFPQACNLLGTAYIAQENWDEAEKAFRKAISLDDKTSDAYLGLGTIFNQTKQYQLAEAPLLRGLELKPDAPMGHYELAKTYWFLGRWQEADPHARNAVSAMPAVGPPHALLGNILLRERNPQGALDEYQEYLRLEPLGSLAPAVRQVVEQLKESTHP